MATLHQVHLKIRELSEFLGWVPVELIMQSVGDNSEVSKHISTLSTLKFIEVDNEREAVTLTLHGRLIATP